MSNTLKLLARTMIVLALMVIGAWLTIRMGGTPASRLLSCAVYLVIGLATGSMVNPRFTKNKSKWIHLIPALIFALIGSQWFMYPYLNISLLPMGIGDYLLQYSMFSWVLSGIFVNLSFR